jgi:hypothetical protein
MKASDQEQNPMEIFVLWHSYIDEDGRDHEMMLGIYSTRAKAEQAVELLRDKPGFRDYPEGFEIAEGKVDRTSMTEGFIRAWGDEEPENDPRS